MNKKENRQKNPTRNKHLTLEQRIEIQECLAKGMTFKDIAKRIAKDQTTVSKEVKRHLIIHRNDFVALDAVCPLLLKAPFVCNACYKQHSASCKFVRQIYCAKQAQKKYEELLVSAREGTPLNSAQFYETENILTNAVINNGQHIYHAIRTYNLPISKSTVYRHISKGYFENLAKIDLPRAVKFKPRKQKSLQYIPKAFRIGRTYDDFIVYMENNSLENVVELDTVIGRIGGKVIMTFNFNAFNFMFGLLLENKTAAAVGRRITEFKHHLENLGFSFGSIFPIILTDNGGEFADIAAFELNDNAIVESRLFFCNPNAPYEKPHIEKNHTVFRDIVPSGTSFDSFTQDTVNLIFSHVNAVKRNKFNGKSPFELFAFSYSVALANALGISYISPEKAMQNPKLIR